MNGSRLDELGTLPLVRFDYKPYIGPTPRPPAIRYEHSAMPTFDAPAYEQMEREGWEGFWQAHPVGATRLTPLTAASYEDAIGAAAKLVATSKPNSAPGNRQAHAVLQAADGAWYASGLGMIVDSDWGPALRLAKLGPLEQHQRPALTALVPELRAVVGGVSTIDLRPRPAAGIPAAAG